MTKIFFIGLDSLEKSSKQFLAAKDTSALKFKSLNHAMYRTGERPDLIIVDKDQRAEASFREFITRFRDIPKIVFSETNSFRGFAPWLKYPQVFPAVGPSVRELEFLMKRALKEKEIIDENSQLRRRVDELAREMEFFDEVSKTLTLSLELDDVLTAMMKKAKKLIKAETWSIFLVDEETGEIVFEKTTGRKEDRKKIRKIRLKLGEGIAGWVAQEGIPVVVPDVSMDERFRPRVSKEADYKAKSLMCVPIRSKGSTLGVLEIINKTTGEPFTKEDLNLLMRLVDHAAIAIERASLYQRMAELSVTDDLTKLFNTRYLDRTLTIELARCRRHSSSLSLIFMDIDHFKLINDNYGHLVGSKLLVEMGQLLIASLRTIDIVARYGGDEFVVVLPQTAPSSAVQIAERIRKSIERNIFLKKEGYSLRLTASFGVASYPESAQSKEDLLRLADEAMYRVKYQTRNGVYAIG
ncbi:MAG: sensor domain-containing diguanylate cyclase [Candidatus Sulfobium sp.]